MSIALKGFKVLDVPLGSGLSFHSFYIKEHLENKVLKANSKTLFVGNIFYKDNLSNDDINELLTDLFGLFGDIESISVSDFQIDNSTFSTRNAPFAHVNFTKKSTLKYILSENSQTIFDSVIPNFIKKWGFSNSNSISSKQHLARKFLYSYG